MLYQKSFADKSVMDLLYDFSPICAKTKTVLLLITFPFGIRASVLWDMAMLPLFSRAAWQHNRDLSSLKVRHCLGRDNASPRPPSPQPSYQHEEAAAALLLVSASWVGGQESCVFLRQQKALLSVTMDVFTKSGPRGDPSSACRVARLHWAANMRHNNSWQSAETTFKTEDWCWREIKTIKSSRQSRYKSTYFIC